MNERHERTLRRLQTDFAFYAPHHLQIVDKMSGVRRAFSFNEAQRLIHEKVEAQRAAKGYVRQIVVKARQQGASTYLTGRGYWRASLNRNTHAFVMTHEMKATQNVFGMVQNYHQNCPAVMRPKATTDAANELKFGGIGSGYTIATARTRSAGRSFTIRFLHCSEVAFWPALSDNLSGLGQALAMAPGTEGYLESTGNGHNEFHSLVQRSLRGESDFEVIFIPWFVTSEYQRPPPAGFELTEEEWEYADTYDLTLSQMAWRRAKIDTDFDGDSTLFDQEYPASIVRAFRRSSTDNPFIRLQNTEAARKRNNRASGVKRIGIDPSQGQDKKDRFMFVERDDTGVRWMHRLPLSTDDTMEAAAACVRLCRERAPDMVFIDRLGLGAGICDAMSRMMPEIRVVGVKASESATNKDRYFNKRTEMWGEVRDWIIGGAELLDNDELEADLTGPGFQFKGEAYLLESKEKMARRELPSPDCFVAGTMVATPASVPWLTRWVPIETLQPGDEVLTPFGTARIQLCRSSIAATVRARFSDGSQLIGTGAHKVFSWLGGAVRLDALTAEHQLDSWRERATWLKWNSWFTGARSSTFKAQAGTFSPDARIRRSDFFTDASGPTFMGRFHRIMTSITRTTTGATASLTTWKRSLWRCIAACTCSSAMPIQNMLRQTPRFSMQRGLWPVSGIAQKPVDSGIARTARPRGSAANQLPLLARSAASISPPFESTSPSSVLEHARPESTTFATTRHLGIVWSALRRLLPTSIAKSPVVPASVERCYGGPVPVYNLTLDRDNAFYANGLLVFNCGDALAHTFYLPYQIARNLSQEEARSGASNNWKTL